MLEGPSSNLNALSNTLFQTHFIFGWIQSLFQTSKMEDGEGLSKTYDSNYMLIKKNMCSK